MGENRGMDERIFERVDSVSGDGLLVGLDRGRLLVRLNVEGQTTSLVLTDPADGRRLADALHAALREPLSVPRRVAL